MTFKLGLTGSIGMGKSTTAQMFVDLGCDLWDADAAVHRLYASDGAAVAPMAEAFPDSVTQDGVSRDALKQIISTDPTALKMIESIVHPLVLADREAFIENARSDIAIFDIPLLFETSAESQFDAVAVVFVEDEVQRQRVLDRGTMSEDQLELILSKQMPAQEKVKRADFVIKTKSFEQTRAQVKDIVKQIRERTQDA